MAARISVARLQSDPSTFILAGDFDPEKHKGLLCPDQRCKCALLGVRAGSRQINGEQVEIAPFFRLPGNAEKSGKGHLPVCRFNVERTVTRWVAASREIRKFDTDPDLLAAGRGKLAEYRLHILMDLLAWRPGGVRERLDDLDATPRSRTGTSYRRSGTNLAPYLRLAKAVLSLVARVQVQEDLAKCIRLKYASKTIPWEDYFFNVTDYNHLYNYLVLCLQQNAVQPIAVVVTLLGRPPLEQTYGDWLLPCRAARVRTPAGHEYALRPSLYFKDRALAEKFCVAPKLLVCGIPRMGGARPVAKAGLRPEASLRLTIISYAQICRFSPALA